MRIFSSINVWLRVSGGVTDPGWKWYQISRVALIRSRGGNSKRNNFPLLVRAQVFSNSGLSLNLHPHLDNLGQRPQFPEYQLSTMARFFWKKIFIKLWEIIPIIKILTILFLFAQNVPKIFSESSWNLLKIFPKFTQTFPKFSRIFLKFAQSLPKIFSQFS